MFWAIVCIAAFFGIWIGFAVYGKSKQWSGTLRWGGGFLAACGAASVAGALLLDVHKAPEAPRQQAAEPAKVVPAAPVKTHNYSLKDGYEYGYEQAISQEERNKGVAANSLMMARFAGQKDGKYQVFTKSRGDSGAIVVAECSNPCEFMKVMSFYQGRHVSTERMRVEPNVIGWMMLEDAINGELQQFVGESEGRKMTVWFDEKKGLTRTVLKP